MVGSFATEYIGALAQRERACIKQLKRFPRPQGIFGGPGVYHPTAEAKLQVLEDFENVAPYLLPKDSSIHVPVLWHTDLHRENIFVDPENPSKVLSIIDWQAVHTAPLFQQVHTPDFLDFEGPKPPEGLESPPSLSPDFEELQPEEQKQARLLLSKQSLYKMYEI